MECLGWRAGTVSTSSVFPTNTLHGSRAGVSSKPCLIHCETSSDVLTEADAIAFLQELFLFQEYLQGRWSFSFGFADMEDIVVLGATSWDQTDENAEPAWPSSAARRSVSSQPHRLAVPKNLCPDSPCMPYAYSLHWGVFWGQCRHINAYVECLGIGEEPSDPECSKDAGAEFGVVPRRVDWEAFPGSRNRGGLKSISPASSALVSWYPMTKSSHDQITSSADLFGVSFCDLKAGLIQ